MYVPPTQMQRVTRAVEKLTRPYTVEHQVRTSQGRRLVVTEHAGLISMLRNAAVSTTSAAGGSASASTRSVIDDDAITKLADLRITIVQLWTDLVPGAVRAGILQQPGISHEYLLTAWHGYFATAHNLGHVADEDMKNAVHDTTWWVRVIETKFDPVRTLELTIPCPECTARWATTGTGELATRVAALQMVFGGERTTVTCRNCSAVWRGEKEIRELDAKARRDDPLFGTG